MFAFGADYSPSPTNHYIIGMESTPDFTMTNAQGQYMPPPAHTKSKSYIDAMYGKRMADFRLRGGLIQSTGGIGADYYAFNDKFKTSVDLFDFGAVNDIRGTNPHARATLSYQVLKYVELLGGMDNFLNSQAATGFIGIGLRFRDDDLKYLVGSGSSFIK
jgi:phospholipid/cholesterol/gamma-HCH transport system substrate-binding protein